MNELHSFLETIEPDLMTVTRLFALPDSLWETPARFSFRAEESSGLYRITFTDVDGNN